MRMFDTLAQLFGLSKPEKIETHQVPPRQAIEPRIYSSYVRSAHVANRRVNKMLRKARRQNQRHMHRLAACRPTY